MIQNWIASLKDKTGRSLPEWLAHIRKHGPKHASAIRDWLKKEHQLGTNSAWLSLHRHHVFAHLKVPSARRIEVGSPADIDADLKRWLKTAYDLDE